jgi:phospholipid/cholesterol/gamma-HCH transport system permease protein
LLTDGDALSKPTPHAMTPRATAELTIGRGPATGTAAWEAHCTGDWTVRGIAALERRIDGLPWPRDGEVAIDAAGIAALDTSGAWLLHRTARALQAQGLAAHLVGLKPEFDSLFQLIASRGVSSEAAAPPAATGTLTTIGRYAWAELVNAADFLAFAGETFTVLLRSIRHPRRIRWRAILHNMQSAGFDALPITGLLSFLLGIVIAYQGAFQLQRFGANIFIVDLVGIAMLRELSPLLTAIIVAGRSGSAYAAQIGTMKVTE